MQPIELTVKHRWKDKPFWPANVHYQRHYAAVAGGMVAVKAQLTPGELKMAEECECPNCCNCGGNDCGCVGCASCNICRYCQEQDGSENGQ